MLRLAPAIQEQILFEADEKITALPEYKINEISRELLWKKQIEFGRKSYLKLLLNTLISNCINHGANQSLICF